MLSILGQKERGLATTSRGRGPVVPPRIIPRRTVKRGTSEPTQSNVLQYSLHTDNFILKVSQKSLHGTRIELTSFMCSAHPRTLATCSPGATHIPSYRGWQIDIAGCSCDPPSPGIVKGDGWMAESGATSVSLFRTLSSGHCVSILLIMTLPGAMRTSQLVSSLQSRPKLLGLPGLG
jgi:hypothetical protein